VTKLSQKGRSVLVTTFRADVTPPLGSMVFGSVRAERLRDPLSVRGVVLQSDTDRYALVAIDWCEVRNASFHLWRSAIAEAIGTSPSKILMSCVHQHDAPRSDRGAQARLDEVGLEGALQDVAFEDRVIASTTAAIRAASPDQAPLTAVTVGRARVAGLVSNRRWRDATGRVRFDRNSTSRTPRERREPVGVVDPTVTSVTLWSEDRRVAVLHHLATHPMSKYGRGDVSADFVGDARAAVTESDPDALHVYLTGCSGDVTVGRHNDGDPANRAVLADRLASAMRSAMDCSRARGPVALGFRAADIHLRCRQGPEFDVPRLHATLADADQPAVRRVDAALRLEWHARASAGVTLDLPRLSLGGVDILVLPAETFVQYQLWARQAAPRRAVLALGNGDGAPGYIPTDAALAEGYDDEYCWVDTGGCEAMMRHAIAQALDPVP